LRVPAPAPPHRRGPSVARHADRIGARSVLERPRTKPLHVTIVSDNEETLERLRAYFDDVGVPTEGKRTVRAAGTLVAATTAVVLFPDDFPERDVIALVGRLRRSRPRVLLLLVTRDPQRFGDAVASDGKSTPPLVLPKPSFGWSILDAIRAHSRAPSAQNGRR
jgi:hypothetical protein